MGCGSSKKSAPKDESSRTSGTSAVTPAHSAGNTQRQTDDFRKNVGPPQGEQRTAVVAPQREISTARQAPVALLMQKTPAQLRAEQEEVMREDSSIRIESPAKYPKRKNSMDLKAEQEKARQDILRVPSIDKEPQLPLIKDVSAAKSNFDRDKFRKANEGTLPPLSSLPLSVQDRLNDIQIIGAVDERTASRPLSTLALLSQKPTSSATVPNMETYISSFPSKV